MRLGLLMEAIVANDGNIQAKPCASATAMAQPLKRLELFGICLAQVEEAMASY